ncbi:MAG: hypothetical protein AABW47_00210 [Nanoarchaeota archaeon]
MKFEIDVAGYDMFGDRDFTICIAKEDGSIVKGFKFNKTLVDSLILDWKNNKFNYPYDAIESKRGRLKARIYCIIVYYLFKSIGKQEFFSLTLCRDFKGRENEICQSIRFLLNEQLGLKTGIPQFRKLLPTSYAHIYANMMRRDKKNFLNTYVNISLEDIEKYLLKKVTPRSR